MKAPVAIALLGTGLVGRAFAHRLARAQRERGVPFTLAFVANARAQRAAPALEPEAAVEALAAAPRLPRDARPPALPSGAIVVDASASATLAESHERWLAGGHRVVAANKLALSGPQSRWLAIRAAGEGRYGDSATVGAGLPVLRTLRALRAGGDRIVAVAGVLSGTLAWLLDGYRGEEAFEARVRRARSLGYTEPDPVVDLSGEDVRRKLVIVARTAGATIEPGDVAVEALPHPDDAGGCAALAARAREAVRTGRTLRYVARWDAAGARAGLESLPRDDVLARGRGADNVVAIHSCRYRDAPLVVAGPGAGPDITAAALLDDVLVLSRQKGDAHLSAESLFSLRGGARSCGGDGR